MAVQDPSLTGVAVGKAFPISSRCEAVIPEALFKLLARELPIEQANGKGDEDV
jgi:hypothetical protein